MASAVKILLAAVVIILTGSLGEKWVGAVHVQVQQQHVVGGDRGWDAASDLASWSSGRTFRVGDNIWLAYSAAQERVAEIKSKEEYESCDVSNPIRMYTEGVNIVSLDKEGSRYLVSGNTDRCKKGLKLHVEVTADVPKEDTSEGSASDVADGPLPSTSAHITPEIGFCVAGLLLLWYTSI